MKRTIALISAFVLLLNLLGCGKAEKEDRSVDSMRSFARYAPMVFATETADTIYFMARLGEPGSYSHLKLPTDLLGCVVCGAGAASIS